MMTLGPVRSLLPSLFLAVALSLGGTATFARADDKLDLFLDLAGAAIYQSNPLAEGWLELTRARFQLQAYPLPRLTVEAHYQLTLTLGDRIRAAGQDPEREIDLRLVDLDPVLASGEDLLLSQNLDRLWLNLRLPGLGIGLGRQVIGHGSGRFFNPTDIFGPLPLFLTYTDYKAGVDALRLTKPWGLDREVELIGVVNGQDFSKGIALARLGQVFSGWNLSAYAGWSLGSPTLGLNLAGDILGAGWYAEGLARLVDDRDLDLRTLVGLDYRFPFGLDVFVELHHNGVGTDDPSGYQEVRQGPEFRAGEIFLVGRWYTALSLSYEFHPLVNGSLLWVQSLTDGSALLSPGLTWEVKEWLDLRLGALLGLGSQTELREEGLAPGTEFGDLGQSIFLELKASF
jgi:hypothetical protein